MAFCGLLDRIQSFEDVYNKSHTTGVNGIERECINKDRVIIHKSPGGPGLIPRVPEFFKENLMALGFNDSRTS